MASLLVVLSGCASTSDEPAPAPRGFAAALGATADETIGDVVTTRMELERDERTTICMKRQGFEYVPDQWSGGSSGRAGDPDRDLTDEEYAAEFGFGIWESFGNPDFSLPDPNTFKSANDDYLETLSETEVAAWRAHLGTCNREGWAAQEEYATLFHPFFAAEQEIRVSVAADRRVVAATTEWVRCMSTEGFLFEHPEQMFRSLLDESRTLVEDDSGNQARALDDIPPPSAESLAFAKREVAIAKASFECSKDLRAIEGVVRAEFEEDRLKNDPAIVEALGDLRND